MKTFPRLPLNALRVFESVARHGSMAKAAEALSVQPSAVSMQMKNLAQHIGTDLVAKQGRRLELTPAGVTLLRAVLAGLGQIDAAVDSLRQSARGGPFTLSVLPSYLHGWLMRRLPFFEAANPAFRLQLLVSRQLVDIAHGAAHAAVRLGSGHWHGLHAELLMEEWLLPVCAPSLRARVGRMVPGRSVTGIKLLHSSVDSWSLWTGTDAARAEPALRIDDTLALVTAAEMGQGVALARWSAVESSLANGRLVAVGECIRYRYDYYWVTRRSSDLDGLASTSSATLLDWLRVQSDATMVAFRSIRGQSKKT